MIVWYMMVRLERLHSCFTAEEACQCVRVLRQSAIFAEFSPTTRLLSDSVTYK